MIAIKVTAEELSNIIFTLNLPMDIVKKAFEQGITPDQDAIDMAIEATQLAERLSK